MKPHNEKKYDRIETIILPEYPRTRHLPWKPNAQRGDLIASHKECAVIFDSPHVFVEEKVDAANCGIALLHGHPIVRNRNHLLYKAFQARTAAKMQFSSIWGWIYNHIECFHKLEEFVSVYGEWMYAVHGVEYNALPDLFMAYDLYDYDAERYLHPGKSRDLLAAAGFKVVPLLHQGPVESWEQLEKLTYGKSPFADGQREGVYIKVSDGQYITHRFKMVRQGFIQGEHWSDRAIKRNKVSK
jgi:atypical dual specificity phosphatase